MKYSTLCLGTRRDAVTWEEGCQKLGMTCSVSIRLPKPSMKAMKSFFTSQGNWLYFGGHFSDYQFANGSPWHEDVLYNHAMYKRSLYNDAGVYFTSDDKTKIVVGLDSYNFRKYSKDFNLYTTAKVILWGGCNTLVDESRARKLMSLFNGTKIADLAPKRSIGKFIIQPPTVRTNSTEKPQFALEEPPIIPATSSAIYSTAMIGFRRMTDLGIVDNVLKGDKGFFAKVDNARMPHNEIVEAWLTAALDVYPNNSDMLSRFAAVDATGQQWVIENKKIKKGFSV
ncbi:hypothetical protein [Pseudaestuariivita rosea]|uniref:hypothetical protein n=1 Tax=Pseudaestuariivita rosea TaxID=2763263 RepID=UPI001ABB6002|nr:hypothetical protein [Pseudaestuariivita rosea]